MLLKGFEVIGALVIGNYDFEKSASKAIDAVCRLKKLLSGVNSEDDETIGAVADLNNIRDVQFFISRSEKSRSLELVTSVVYDEHPQKHIWETGCLLRCELPIRFPVYFPAKNPPGTLIFDTLFFLVFAGINCIGNLVFVYLLMENIELWYLLGLIFTMIFIEIIIKVEKCTYHFKVTLFFMQSN